MAKLPRVYYSLMLLALVVVLAGCELRRDDADLSDPGPVSDLPPTLAPLGAETESVAEATPIPTVINVQPTATQSNLAEGQAAADPDEPVAPTSQPAVDLSESSVVSGEGVEGASSEAPESFVPPAAEESSEDIVVAEEAIVVDANSDELPSGGPVAANPPASQTSGNYGSATYDDSTYTVQPGDTLFSIAQRYGTSVEAIVYANGLTSDFIYAGQELNIPGGDGSVPTYEQPAYQQPTYEQPYQQPGYQQPYAPGAGDNYHVVTPGETLFRIALQYGTSVDAIAGANGIPYPYLIQAGQRLVIPAPGSYAGPPPPPAGGYYQQPPQGYAPPAPENDYYAQPPQDNYTNPGNAGTHTVAPGETLYSIALRYGTTADALASANGLYNPNQIYVGQVLYLP